VHVQPAVVVNEAKLAELIHEVTDAERVVPIISASVSRLIFAITGSGLPSSQSGPAGGSAPAASRWN
jgi:hypothetical protein